MSVCRGCRDIDPSRALNLVNVLAAANFRVYIDLMEAAWTVCESTRW
jgi:hypothetical protein